MPEHVQRPGGAVGDPGGGAQRAAELAHDAGGGQAVADDIADGHRHPVPGQVGQVVPVAADVERADRGPVAHRGPVVPHGQGRGQHRLLEGQRHLPLPGVGQAEPLVDLLQFLGAGVQLGLHPHPVDGMVPGTGPDDLGDLLDPVHDQPHPSVGVEHGRIDRAPVPLLERPRAGPAPRRRSAAAPWCRGPRWPPHVPGTPGDCAYPTRRGRRDCRGRHRRGGARSVRGVRARPATTGPRWHRRSPTAG